MHKQFLRFALVLFLTILLLLFGISALYDVLSDEPPSYQLSVKELFAHNAQRPVELADGAIQFPEQLQQQLQQGEVVAIDNQDGTLNYYYQQQNQLLSLGPLPNQHRVFEQRSNYFAVVFYSLLALALLLLLYPLARDIVRLRQSAQHFALKPEPLQIELAPQSVLQPLAVAMNAMSARIAALLQQQQDVANTVAHEIRTPLARMAFVVQRVASQLDDVAAGRLERDIDEINQLVSDYLNFARTENAQVATFITEQTATALLADLQEKFRNQHSNVALHFNYDGKPCYFDSRQMSIALQNLINNGLRYARSQLNITWCSDAQYCVMKVEDDGDGLAGKAEAMKRAFTRQARDTSDIGFGLGLYITQQIAQRHQGSLDISTSSLGGACFIMRWPNQAAVPPAS
ncbi:MAG TPA: ATP-binding protein [Rheinheimera sp.]|nr:ATP-binding protein [Rheinheimera sp.]